ncbi:hypothetical protein OKA05_24690 [Luteolibacter arcticus]|uniref:DUF945 domain-containing protein n=1 Tax=Luteolibacter arcticus TaxID=1581411 RepID=A0ABT3GQM2_9BACT|nr:hypothetical protein [Luteolibacter arcticus]MCW1925779.1 hypothetical protein [Luteolibacter arcticus]
MKKKRVIAAVILLLVLFCLHRGADHLERTAETTTTRKHDSSSSSAAENEAESTRLPTKASSRPANTSTHATHRPEQLKQFYLPEVTIDGLPLKAALAKLRAAYEDVCRESGEVPVRLTFIVPPEATRPLTTKTGIRNLDGSIHLLAALAGLKVARSGSEYTFTAPEETGEVTKRTFRVPPDFFSIPAAANEDPFAEDAAPFTRLTPSEYFASKGITLDPGTKFSFTAATGTLQIEATSAADQTAIAGLIDLAANEMPIQHQMNARVVEIPARMDWTPQEISQLDAGEQQLLMRQLSQIKGVDLMTAPSVTARTGENSKIAITHEVLIPSLSSPGDFEAHDTGVIFDLRTVPYGLGHHVDLAYSERIAEGESGTATAKVIERTSINDSSFTGDGKARLHMQTRPDGTRALVLITPTLIDATGRPLHAKE